MAASSSATGQARVELKMVSNKMQKRDGNEKIRVIARKQEGGDLRQIRERSAPGAPLPNGQNGTCEEDSGTCSFTRL